MTPYRYFLAVWSALVLIASPPTGGSDLSHGVVAQNTSTSLQSIISPMAIEGVNVNVNIDAYPDSNEVTEQLLQDMITCASWFTYSASRPSGPGPQCKQTRYGKHAFAEKLTKAEQSHFPNPAFIPAYLKARKALGSLEWHSQREQPILVPSSEKNTAKISTRISNRANRMHWTEDIVVISVLSRWLQQDLRKKEQPLTPLSHVTRQLCIWWNEFHSSRSSMQTLEHAALNRFDETRISHGERAEAEFFSRYARRLSAYCLDAVHQILFEAASMVSAIGTAFTSEDTECTAPSLLTDTLVKYMPRGNASGDESTGSVFANVSVILESFSRLYSPTAPSTQHPRYTTTTDTNSDSSPVWRWRIRVPWNNISIDYSLPVSANAFGVSLSSKQRNQEAIKDRGKLVAKEEDLRRQVTRFCIRFGLNLRDCSSLQNEFERGFHTIFSSSPSSQSLQSVVSSELSFSILTRGRVDFKTSFSRSSSNDLGVKLSAETAPAQSKELSYGQGLGLVGITIIERVFPAFATFQKGNSKDKFVDIFIFTILFVVCVVYLISSKFFITLVRSVSLRKSLSAHSSRKSQRLSSTSRQLLQTGTSGQFRTPKDAAFNGSNIYEIAAKGVDATQPCSAHLSQQPPINVSRDSSVDDGVSENRTSYGQCVRKILLAKSSHAGSFRDSKDSKTGTMNNEALSTGREDDSIAVTDTELDSCDLVGSAKISKCFSKELQPCPAILSLAVTTTAMSVSAGLSVASSVSIYARALLKKKRRETLLQKRLSTKHSVISRDNSPSEETGKDWKQIPMQGNVSDPSYSQFARKHPTVNNQKGTLPRDNNQDLLLLSPRLSPSRTARKGIRNPRLKLTRTGYPSTKFGASGIEYSRPEAAQSKDEAEISKIAALVGANRQAFPVQVHLASSLTTIVPQLPKAVAFAKVAQVATMETATPEDCMEPKLTDVNVCEFWSDPVSNQETSTSRVTKHAKRRMSCPPSLSYRSAIVAEVEILLDAAENELIDLQCDEVLEQLNLSEKLEPEADHSSSKDSRVEIAGTSKNGSVEKDPRLALPEENTKQDQSYQQSQMPQYMELDSNNQEILLDLRSSPSLKCVPFAVSILQTDKNDLCHSHESDRKSAMPQAQYNTLEVPTSNHLSPKTSPSHRPVASLSLASPLRNKLFSENSKTSRASLYDSPRILGGRNHNCEAEVQCGKNEQLNIELAKQNIQVQAVCPAGLHACYNKASPEPETHGIHSKFSSEKSEPSGELQEDSSEGEDQEVPFLPPSSSCVPKHHLFTQRICPGSSRNAKLERTGDGGADGILIPRCARAKSTSSCLKWTDVGNLWIRFANMHIIDGMSRFLTTARPHLIEHRNTQLQPGSLSAARPHSDQQKGIPSPTRKRDVLTRPITIKDWTTILESSNASRYLRKRRPSKTRTISRISKRISPSRKPREAGTYSELSPGKNLKHIVKSEQPISVENPPTLHRRNRRSFLVNGSTDRLTAPANLQITSACLVSKSLRSPSAAGVLATGTKGRRKSNGSSGEELKRRLADIGNEEARKQYFKLRLSLASSELPPRKKRREVPKAILSKEKKAMIKEIRSHSSDIIYEGGEDIAEIDNIF